jgi:hypothetical protein
LETFSSNAQGKCGLSGKLDQDDEAKVFPEDQQTISLRLLASQCG